MMDCELLKQRLGRAIGNSNPQEFEQTLGSQTPLAPDSMFQLPKWMAI